MNCNDSEAHIEEGECTVYMKCNNSEAHIEEGESHILVTIRKKIRICPC